MITRQPRPTSDPADLEAEFEAELGPLIATLLGVVGPMSVARISAVLARAGHFDPLRVEGYDDEDLEALVEWVVDDELVFFATGDDLVAHVPTVLDGVVLSHRLTPDEHERGMLDLGVDLAVLTRSHGRLPLFGGGHAVVHHHWGDRPDDLLLDALAHDPTLLRSPDAPLSVALDAAGLSWDGDALTRLGP